MREPELNGFVNSDALERIGLNHNILGEAIRDTYQLLDQIDATLEIAGVFPLSQTVELANFSSMIGNIFASAIAKHSQNLLKRDGPHKYPDLLTTGLFSRKGQSKLKNLFAAIYLCENE